METKYDIYKENIELALKKYAKSSLDLSWHTMDLLEEFNRSHTDEKGFTLDDMLWTRTNFVIDKLDEARRDIGVLLENVLDLAKAIDEEAWKKND